jgi:hypothetical protein
LEQLAQIVVLYQIIQDLLFNLPELLLARDIVREDATHLQKSTRHLTVSDVPPRSQGPPRMQAPTHATFIHTRKNTRPPFGHVPRAIRQCA